MELRLRNKATGEIGIAFMTDSDAEVLRAMGYEHFDEEDFTDDENDGEWVEVWKPIKEENNAKAFCVLIDQEHSMHYGYTLDEDKANAEAKRIEEEYGCQIDIYEFANHSEF
jgi:hypothetical protein